MIRKVLFGVLILFLVELTVLIWVGSKLGVITTLALLILSSAIGIMVIRVQGYETIRITRQQLTLGQPPGHAILNGVLLVFASILLIFPGFISDLFGILLFIPITRKVFHYITYIWLRNWAGRFKR